MLFQPSGLLAKFGASRPTATASILTPGRLAMTQRAVAVIAGIHVLALALLLVHQDVIMAVVAADSLGLSADQVAVAAQSAVLQSVVPHVVIPILLLWRGRSLASGRQSARFGLTILLLIQLVAHATLPLVLHRLPGFEVEIVIVQAVSLGFELFALALLWGRFELDRPSLPAGRQRHPAP